MNTIHINTSPGPLSRRDLLKGATALTAAASVPEAFGQQPTGAPHGTVWLYIGTYTGAPGSGGNGEGIYLCELNLSKGNLTVLRLAAPGLPATAMNPQSRNEAMMPTSPAPTACQNEMPKPSSKA